MNARVVRLLLLLLAIYAFYAWQMHRLQRGMLFPGTALPREAVQVPGAQPVEVPGSFGTIELTLLPASVTSARAPAAIYLHGNYESAARVAPDLAPLRSLGLHVLIVEFPGYAGADGEPTLESLREAANAGYDWLARDPRVDPARIVAIGRSIGSGPASLLAGDRELRALLLLSPFHDLDAFAHERLLPAVLIRDRYDNAAQVRAFGAPVLVLHGRDDPIIPFDHGERLAAAARDGTLVAFDCGHNDCDYWSRVGVDAIRRFLQHAGVLDPP